MPDCEIERESLLLLPDHLVHQLGAAADGVVADHQLIAVVDEPADRFLGAHDLAVCFGHTILPVRCRLWRRRRRAGLDSRPHCGLLYKCTGRPVKLWGHQMTRPAGVGSADVTRPSAPAERNDTMSIRFDGRVAIVTGAGGGLGRCYALELARRGAKVVVNDLGGALDGTSGSASLAQAVADEITAAGGVAVANHDSVTDRAAAQRMVDEAVSRFGSLDILVNNAGILRDKTFVKLELDDFQKVVDVHLMGSVNVTKAAFPVMKEKGLRPDRPHHLLVGPLRELRTDQLRRRQAGPGGFHEHPQARRGEVRHQGQRGRTHRRDPDDRRPVAARSAQRGGPRACGACRHLPLQRGKPQRPHHRGRRYLLRQGRHRRGQGCRPRPAGNRARTWLQGTRRSPT